MSNISKLPKAEVLDFSSVTPNHFAAGEILATHTDDRDELALVAKGAITAIIEGKTFEVTAGHAIVFPAGVAHSVEAIQDSAVILVED